MKMKNLFFIIGLATLLLVGCNSGSNTNLENASENSLEEETTSEEILSIENLGKNVEFTKIPERVIAIGQPPAEIMLALGLGDYIVGTTELIDAVSPEYKEAYESIRYLSDDYPSKEVFFGAEPDFAFAYPSASGKSAFIGDYLGTRDELEEIGVKTYLQESTTNIEATPEDIYQDIRNIGKIFNVEEKADQLIEKMEAEIQATLSSVNSNGSPKSVFVYDSGDTTLFTAGHSYMSNLIKTAGGENVFDDIEKVWAQVSWEEVVDRNPEIIVIVDYKNVSADEKMNQLLNNPALSNVTAIQNENFVVIPLSAAMAGIRIPEALEILVNGFRNIEEK